jgi:hypothetical protein
VTFDVGPDFHEVGMRWVSDAVGESAMRALFDHGENKAAQLLFGLANGDERGAFGCAFESHAHLRLAKGGTFRTRAIGAAGAHGNLTLTPADTVWYAQGAEGTVANAVRKRRHRCAIISVVWLPDVCPVLMC